MGELVSRKRARDARPYGIWGDVGLVFSEAAEFSLEIFDLTAHVGDGICGRFGGWGLGFGGLRGCVVDFDPARGLRAGGWSIGGCWGARLLGVGFFLGLLDEVVYEAFGFFGGHFASIDKFVS